MALRDLALTLLILGAIPVAIARPLIGVMFFVWLSLMNPHRLTWGFAANFSWAQWIAIATIIGFVATHDRQLVDAIKRYRYALIYLAWTAITTAMAFRFDASWPKFMEFLKTQLMCLIALSLLTTRKRVEVFVIVCVLSLAFYGLRGGVFTIITGGNYRVWGPTGTVLADNNQLGTALTMCIPVLFWLAHWVKARWQSLAVYALMVLTAFAVFGTHSRGSFLAAVAMAVFLFFKSHRKVLTLLLAVVFAAIGLYFMPEAYWERIASIADYQEDGSAQGRLEMWGIAIAVANDHITGGGFDMYRSGQFLDYVKTTVRSPHSIYFQALGEHGWLGLTLMLTFWTSIWWQCRSALKAYRQQPGSESIVLLLRMLQVSFVGFAVGGMFVNIGYWDFPFFLAVTVLALRRAQSEIPATAANTADTASRGSTRRWTPTPVRSG